MKKISFFIGLLLIVLISAPYWPWKNWAHYIIQTQLAKNNIAAEFTVENISPGTLAIKNIDIKDSPISFDSLDVVYNTRELVSKRLVIDSIMLRSKDGEFSTKNIQKELFHPSVTTFTVTVRDVPLKLVMNLLSSGRADAEGVVSGTLPITVQKDGSILIKEGRLSAGKSGRIKISQDLIPGENEQISLVRSALSNFHYREFSMELNSREDKKLSMLLQLRGNNPDVYNGREIRLNVRLEGDLLETVQQSVISISDPKQLLEQK